MKQNTIHHYACPLCGCKDIKFEYKVRDYQVSQEYFEIWHCPTCGLKITQDAPIPDRIEAYYISSAYLPHCDKTTPTGIAYKIARHLMTRMKLNLIHHYQPKPGTLIDVGAGSGYFMARAQLQGWNVSGCEQSTEARKAALVQWGLSIDGNVSSCHYPTASADVITAWHSIEHIHDQGELWQKFQHWLKDDGLLVIAVPNCLSTDALHYGAHWAAWDVPRHLWHFNSESINRLASKHGFHLVATKTLPLDVFYIALLSERFRGNPF